MNLIQLRYFVKTAQLLNYSRAAEELLVARQSLRQSIAALEEEIGRPLFINTKNHLSLTEYGAYLALAGQETLDAFDRMEEGLNRLISRSSGLNLGFSTTLAPFILPNTDAFLRAFRARFPDVLDAGFVLQMPVERPGCRMDVIREFEVALDHADPKLFGGERRVGPEALRGVACLGMGSRPLTMAPLWEDCQRMGIDFPYHIVSDTLDAFYHMKHDGTVGFDILKTDVPEFSWDHTSVLEGYRWEVGLLSSTRVEDPNLLTLFFRFMKQAFENHWAQYERNYSAADTGFD